MNTEVSELKGKMNVFQSQLIESKYEIQKIVPKIKIVDRKTESAVERLDKVDIQQHPPPWDSLVNLKQKELHIS